METGKSLLLHMNKGVGQSSYAENSLVQRIAMRKSKMVIEENMKELYDTLTMPECLMMADMGCGSGPNVLEVVSIVMDMVNNICKSLNRRDPEFMVFLNDLPGNDFNTLNQFLPNFYMEMGEENGSHFGSCCVTTTSKSYYGRVFPNQFLHFVHSCYSLHWLSQIPKELVTIEGVALNKGNIHIAKTSPMEVQKAYYKQFQRDFTLFLRSRASEVVHGGFMVLTFQCSPQSNCPNTVLDLLGSALRDMVFEGIIEEEKLDMFNMPMYFPTAEEVKQLIETEGSFTLNKLETFSADWSVDDTQNLHKRTEFVAKSIKVVMESLFTGAFGEASIDELFLRFKDKVEKQYLAKQTTDHFNILISITRKF